MPIEAVVKQATGLPDKYVDMAVSYIQYLQAQFDEETKLNTGKKRSIGAFADKFQFIADDFDDIPEEFKEYV